MVVRSLSGNLMSKKTLFGRDRSHATFQRSNSKPGKASCKTKGKPPYLELFCLTGVLSTGYNMNYRGKYSSILADNHPEKSFLDIVLMETLNFLVVKSIMLA